MLEHESLFSVAGSTLMLKSGVVLEQVLLVDLFKPCSAINQHG
jgi:hypothetical protein